MNGNPTYTIAIPAFKASFLAACIHSVLKQRYADYELVIVNDASPEPIDEIVSSFSDSRIRYYKNSENAGAEHMVNNWNRCLELARGTYFVLLGDDDFLDDDYLEAFNELIARYPTLDVFHCRSKIVDVEGQIVDLTPPWPSYETIYDNMYYRLNMSRIQYISDFVYRTETLKIKGGFFYLPLAWGADDITAFIAIGEKGIAHCPKPVFNYRESALTITRSGNAQKKMEAVLLQEQWFKTFLAKEPNDEGDMIIYKKLQRELSDFLLRRRADIVKDALRASGWKGVLYWLRKTKVYRISGILIVRIYVGLWREKLKGVN